MNELERARFDLEMILPYVNYLKNKVHREERKLLEQERTRQIPQQGEIVVFLRLDRIK